MDRFVNPAHIRMWLKFRFAEVAFGGVLLMVAFVLTVYSDGKMEHIYNKSVAKYVFELLQVIPLTIIILIYYYFMCLGVFFSIFLFTLTSNVLNLYNMKVDSALNCLSCGFIVEFLLHNEFPQGDFLFNLSFPRSAMACFFAAHICMHAAAALRQYRKARRQPIA